MTHSIDLADLFNKEPTNPNILLLKKIVALGYFGNLQINGQLPNAAYSLKDYLLTSGNFIVDFSALDATTRHEFEKWFIQPHMNDAQEHCWQNVITNDHRGYTTESELNWWGRLLNFLFYRRSALNWSIGSLAMRIDAQLQNIHCCLGANGFLLGFDFFNPASLFDFQKKVDVERINGQANSKRILLTPEIVNTLIHTDLKTFNPVNALDNMHPSSIEVTDEKLPDRQYNMDEYRYTNLFEYKYPLYKRFWNWLVSLFSRFIPSETVEHTAKSVTPVSFDTALLNLADEEFYGISINYDTKSGKVQVYEKCPDIDSVVYGGGGGKIFAHVGAKAALEDFDIQCKNFAGSSAGAIMALLDYLGYTSAECQDFFESVNKDVLVHYDIDWNGLSDPRALKAALDYAINKKVLEIIDQYKLTDTYPGRHFLSNEILPDGIITFASLHKLKKKFPDCSLGEKLKVTATNKTQNKTVVFSLDNTPGMEVSEAVKISASIPPVYKHTLINGEPHTDGGALRNILSEAFPDTGKTLLSSLYKTHLGSIVFCFDNGVEMKLISNFRSPINNGPAWYNFLCSLLTGVDSASGWKEDLIKLVQNSHHVVILPADVASTEFTVLPGKQQELFRYGYKPTVEHLLPMYNSATKKVEQGMHAIFSSLEELMVHCALRGKKDLFQKLKPFAIKHGVSEKRLSKLENSHLFNSTDNNNTENKTELKKKYKSKSLLEKLNSKMHRCRKALCNMRIFDALYPVFLPIQKNLFLSEADFSTFKKARHFLSPMDNKIALDELSKLKGQQHLMIHILINVLKKTSTSQLDTLCTKLRVIDNTFKIHGSLLSKSIWFHEWNLTDNQIDKIIDFLDKNKFDECFDWMRQHQKQKIYAQLNTNYPNNTGCKDEYFNNGIIEGNWQSISV